MSTLSFNFEKPKSTEGIVSRLAQAGGKAVILAGGTDLLPQLRSRLVQPSLVLDIKGVEQLHCLEATAEGLAIGAAVVLNRVLEQPQQTAPYRALVQAVGDLASYPIRNRATLVGNVANASPCADTVPPLCVMGARVQIQGPDGQRSLPVEQFIVGNREVRLEPGEFVTRVLVPPLSAGSFSGFQKRKRVKGHDLALANVALLRDPERQQLRLGVGSCTPAPAVLDLSEMFARPDVDEAVQRAQQTINPINDVRASVEYRREMVAVMVRRLFADMAQA